MRCPCRKCENTCMMKSEDVQMHVLASVFVEGYSRWTCHGEDAVDVGSGSEDDDVLRYDLAYDSEEETRVDEEANVEGEGAPRDRIAEMLDDPYLREQLEDPEDEAELLSSKNCWSTQMLGSLHRKQKISYEKCGRKPKNIYTRCM